MKKIPSKKCPNCEAYFQPTRTNQVYCDGRCRNQFNNERARQDRLQSSSTFYSDILKPIEVDSKQKGLSQRSLDTIKQHLAYKQSTQKTMYVNDVRRLFLALIQFEKEGLEIVGMGYRRYDGQAHDDRSDGSILYEGGYTVKRKIA